MIPLISHLSNSPWKSLLYPCSLKLFCCSLILHVFFSYHRGLSINPLYHLILPHSQQYDVNLTGNYSDFIMFQRATTSNSLSTNGRRFLYWILWIVEMSKRSVGHIAKYWLSPDRHRDISCSHVSYLNQWNCDILVRGKKMLSFFICLDLELYFFSSIDCPFNIKIMPLKRKKYPNQCNQPTKTNCPWTIMFQYTSLLVVYPT